MYFVGINLQRLQGKRMFGFEFDVLLAFVIIFLSETLPLESILHLIPSRFNVAFPLIIAVENFTHSFQHRFQDEDSKEDFSANGGFDTKSPLENLKCVNYTEGSKMRLKLSG